MTLDDECGEMLGDPTFAGKVIATLQALAEQRVQDGLAALVEELGDLGFSWRDVARIAGVSLPALHRWRQGVSTSGGNVKRAAMLVVLCETARGDRGIDDVVGRLEAPIGPAAPLTGMDLVVNDRSWTSSNPAGASATPPTSRCLSHPTVCLVCAFTDQRVESQSVWALHRN